MREITKSIEYSPFTGRNGATDKLKNLGGLSRYGTLFYFVGAGLLGTFC